MTPPSCIYPPGAGSQDRGGEKDWESDGRFPNSPGPRRWQRNWGISAHHLFSCLLLDQTSQDHCGFIFLCHFPSSPLLPCYLLFLPSFSSFLPLLPLPLRSLQVLAPSPFLILPGFPLFVSLSPSLLFCVFFFPSAPLRTRPLPLAPSLSPPPSRPLPPGRRHLGPQPSLRPRPRPPLARPPPFPSPLSLSVIYYLPCCF